MKLSAFTILTTSSTFVVGISPDTSKAQDLAMGAVSPGGPKVSCWTFVQSEADKDTDAARTAMKIGARRLVKLVEDDPEFKGLKAPSSPKDNSIVAIIVDPGCSQAVAALARTKSVAVEPAKDGGTVSDG